MILSPIQRKKLMELKDPMQHMYRVLIEKLELAKGEKGDNPTKEELLNLIKPLIPKPINPTREELLNLIKPLIPKPIKGNDGRNPLTVSYVEPLKPQIGDLWYQP